MKITARAPGKLILFGEYAVLEGAPAVVTAVDRSVHTVVEPSEDDRWFLTSDQDEGGRRELDPRARAPWIAGAIRETLRCLGAQPEDLPSLAIEVRSAELFGSHAQAKLGLGSSAAIVVALGGALRRFVATLEPGAAERDACNAFGDALHVHHALQGSGSGIDVAASFHGGVIAFTRDAGPSSVPTVERLAPPADLHLACIWTGTSASTASFLERMPDGRRRRTAAFDACIEHMANVSGQALEAFRRGLGADLAQLANEYHDAMADLGRVCGLPIVSTAHQTLAELARAADAAYKPSGAGGGDVGLLLAETRSALETAVQAAQGAGYGLVDLAIGETGLTVHPS